MQRTRSDYRSMQGLVSRIFPSLFAGFLAFMPATAPCQIQQQSLNSKLKGVEAESVVMIGDTGAPVGYNAPYPVNTLVYPDGRVEYRVEWAMMRGEVGRMEKSFPYGTHFHIAAVDWKDDRLELKLQSDHGSGRLKLMFGQNWQSTMTESQVFDTIGKAISIATNVPQVTQASAGSAPTQAASSAPSPSQVRYVRPAGLADLPERPKAADIQAILDSLEQRKQSDENSLKQAAVPFAQAFRAFEQQYSGIRRTGPVQDIIVLRAKLGNDFVPKDASDIDAIQMVFARCLRTDAIQSPAEESPAYRRSFPGGDVGTAQQHSTDHMKAIFKEITTITTVEDSILKIEQTADTNSLSVVTSYDTLASDQELRCQETTNYLRISASFRTDLNVVKELRATYGKPGGTIAQNLHQLADAKARLETLHDEPLAHNYLAKVLVQAQGQLKKKIEDLPQFTFRRDDYTSAVRPTKDFSISENAEKLTKLTTLLASASELVKLMDDPQALQIVRSNFGEETYSALLAKAHDIPAAQETRTRLDQLDFMARQTQAEETAAKEATIKRRQTLGGDIVDKCLIIVKLDERFQQTEVMGYKMEADKTRTALASLIQTNRGMLDTAVRAEIHAGYERILPGLTVWEANRFNQVLDLYLH